MTTVHVDRWLALVWKASYESRGRFWISLVSLLALVSYVVLSGPAYIAGFNRTNPGESLAYSEYIWQALFNYYFQGFWTIAALLLGFGGVLRERATGVASLTFGLPLSRAATIASRAAVGVGEAIALAVIPTVAIPALSTIAGVSYPLTQAVEFGFLLASGGLVFFCYGILLSAIFETELTVFIVGFVTVSTVFVGMKARAVHRFSVFDVMNGARSINSDTHFIERSLPWLGISLSLAVATLLLASATLIIRKRDF